MKRILHSAIFRLAAWIFLMLFLISSMLIVFVALIAHKDIGGDNSSLVKVLIILTSSIVPSIILLSVAGSVLISYLTFKPMKTIIHDAESINSGDDLSLRIKIKHGSTEMNRLTAAFNAMIARLENSFKTEKQFASDVSHELRTPLAVIKAECSHSLKKATTKEDFDESVKEIDKQADYMSDLINSLLTLTRIQHGTDKYPMKEADLSEFINSLCDDYVPADRRNIKLTSAIDAGLTAQFNPTLISRILQNLLENAYKYGRDGGNIGVALYREGSSAVLRVSDDGQGIAPENLEKVWLRFWQADGSRTEGGSSGLGLAMVKEMTEFHGGSVACESSLGEGSSFIISLPLSEPAKSNS